MKRVLASISTLILLSTTSGAAAQASRPRPSPPGPSTSATEPAPSPRTPPSPVGTSGASTAAAADVSADYRLVPGDKLRIEVYKDAQLSQNVQVRPDGKVTLPLANDVVAAGRTPTELRDAIAASLETYITNPTVTVIVVETVPPVFYVMGEVMSPGPQPLNGQVSVLQALAMAGGFKDFADRDDITIRRGAQVMKFNYKDAVRGDAKDVSVKAGDTIIVP